VIPGLDECFEIQEEFFGEHGKLPPETTDQAMAVRRSLRLCLFQAGICYPSHISGRCRDLGKMASSTALKISS
jgi:hypothetical protein